MCRNSDLIDHITVISRATGKVHERMKTTAAQEVWPPKICTQVAQNAVLEIPLALHAATHHPPIILSFPEPTWSSHRGTSARSLNRKGVHSHNHHQKRNRSKQVFFCQKDISNFNRTSGNVFLPCHSLHL